MTTDRRTTSSTWAMAAVLLLLACSALLGGCAKKSVDVGEVQPVTVQGTPLAPFESTDGDPAVATTPPALMGSGFDGKPVAIDPSSGPLMLVFLAHWCPHCNREVPRLLQWKASGAVPAGLDVIGITTKVDPNLPNYPPSKWIAQIGWDWPVMADSAGNDAADAYGLTGYPYFVVIGADGKVKARHSGEIEVADLTRLVDQALAS